MQNKIPHFKHVTRGGSKKHIGFIETDGEIIHEIENIEKFYKAFGYTQDIAKAGVLPDEFIWDEYIKGSSGKYSACLQMHILKYLNKHSKKFRKKYSDRYISWMLAHAEERTSSGDLCFTCRLKPYCEKVIAEVEDS